MFKYRVISGPYFPVFGLNAKIYGVNLRIQSEYRKYGPKITPHLDTFHAVFFYFIDVFIYLKLSGFPNLFGTDFLINLKFSELDFLTLLRK